MLSCFYLICQLGYIVFYVYSYFVLFVFITLSSILVAIAKRSSLLPEAIKYVAFLLCNSSRHAVKNLFLSSLERVIGNDTPEKIQALKDLKEDWAGMSKQAKQSAMKEILEAQQEAEQYEQAELEEAVDELDEGRDEIESHFGKPLTEKQWDAYKDYLLDIEPKGGYQEYPDFIKTFDYFKKVNSRSNATAKTLASRSMERSAPASNQEAPKGNSWKDWEAEKEKLLNK